jgi:Fe-S-cluster containining protein
MDFGSKGFCTVYENRPQMCVDFPMQPADIWGLPECGYRFLEARQRKK